jgi:hypothetical protein
LLGILFMTAAMNTPDYDHVRESTDPEVNARIDREIRENVRRYRDEGPAAVRQRLEDLDHEWDIERVLEVNASAIALSGVLLSIRDRRFLLIPIVVLSFLLQHAIQGWCPPLPIFRKLGVRTRKEIDREKFALLTGDDSSERPQHAAGALERDMIRDLEG